MTAALFPAILALAVAGYLVNRRAARLLRDGGRRLHSTPGFHGAWSALLVLLPALLLTVIWLALQERVVTALALAELPALPDDPAQRALVAARIREIAAGRALAGDAPELARAAAVYAALKWRAGLALVLAALSLALGGLVLAWRQVAPEARMRQRVERATRALMIAASLLAVVVTVGIFASLIVEALRFFARVPVTEFLFGTRWEPQIAIRADQVAGTGAFGWLPVFLGTLVITVIALGFATPVGLLAAIYLFEFAPPRLRDVAKPVLEILAGVPTVVYGFFAVLTVTPALRGAGEALGVPVSPNTALAAGGVMGIMLIPFISSFADDALSAVPRALRDGALALGATRGEAITRVLFPAALPGIAGGILLAVSRAIGETMIVVMAAGLIARMTVNPLDSVTTVTVQIVTLLTGDTEFDNPRTLAAFALGLMLFCVTLLLNVIALQIVRRYREAYE